MFEFWSEVRILRENMNSEGGELNVERDRIGSSSELFDLQSQQKQIN